jgi:hypothetical protein
MSSDRRQRVERVPGSRRAKLTPAPGTTSEPTESDDDASAETANPTGGPNDDRMRRDVPPHY